MKKNTIRVVDVDCLASLCSICEKNSHSRLRTLKILVSVLELSLELLVALNQVLQGFILHIFRWRINTNQIFTKVGPFAKFIIARQSPVEGGIHSALNSLAKVVQPRCSRGFVQGNMRALEHGEKSSYPVAALLLVFISHVAIHGRIHVAEDIIHTLQKFRWSLFIKVNLKYWFCDYEMIMCK